MAAEGMIRVVDQFIREKDGTTTQITWMNGTPVFAHRDVPIHWFIPDDVRSVLTEAEISPHQAGCTALTIDSGIRFTLELDE